MSNTKYILETQTTYFYDPHTTPDFGRRVVYVQKLKPGDYRLDWEENVEYTEGYIEDEDREGYIKAKDDTEVHQAMDGYNYQKDYWKIKFISEEQFHIYGSIIKTYEMLNPSRRW